MIQEREQENAEKMKIQAKERDEENRHLPGFQALEARLGAIEEKINEIEVAKEKMMALVVKDAEQMKDVESGKIVEKNVIEQSNVVIKDMKAVIDEESGKKTNDTEKANKNQSK